MLKSLHVLFRFICVSMLHIMLTSVHILSAYMNCMIIIILYYNTIDDKHPIVNFSHE